MKLLGFVVVFLFSGAVAAADYSIKICNIQAQTDRDDVFIQPCENWTSKNSCSNGGWITWSANSFQGQAMYSSAMAALMADKNVTVRFDGSTCNTFDVTSMIRLSSES